MHFVVFSSVFITTLKRLEEFTERILLFWEDPAVFDTYYPPEQCSRHSLTPPVQVAQRTRCLTAGGYMQRAHESFEHSGVSAFAPQVSDKLISSSWLWRIQITEFVNSFCVCLCVFVVGIDSEGHAANYVETEQIVQYNGAKASFVQVSQTLSAPAEITWNLPFRPTIANRKMVSKWRNMGPKASFSLLASQGAKKFTLKTM